MFTLYYVSFFFFFNDRPPPEISTLPLHDALPIWAVGGGIGARVPRHCDDRDQRRGPRRRRARHPGGAAYERCSRGNSRRDRKSTRLNSSHSQISYAVFCLKKKKSRYLCQTAFSYL